MDKSAIKSFAIEARKILMKSAITQAGFYGVSKDGCSQPTQKGAGFEVYRTIAGTDNRIFGDDIKRREKLVKAVEEKGFEQVIEETAYTWFNRLMAIRFMEVNGYLPTRTRVLSSETGSNTPDLMSQYMDVDLDMTMDELEKVQTFVRENRYDDAFALLFVKQCNALNEILPELFERTTDYMELLLKLSYTSDGVVRMLVDMIPESNFDIEQEGQIEIIGWLYQYYNTELKDDTFALLKKNVKITKERIPSATQLFTPDWIVRYMVENSLGRLWIEGHPDEDLKANWKYYLEEAEQEADAKAQLEKIREDYKAINPEDIKVIDPCMGSGHILVYCFDLLMQIYVSQGYTERDAARLILENNLYGLDIDKRAAQLAYFAIMMKARQYDRRIFSRIVNPHVYVIEESNGINYAHLNYFGKGLNEFDKNEAQNQVRGLLQDLKDAKEYGSIIDIYNYDWELLYLFISNVSDEGQLSFDIIDIDLTQERLYKLLEIGQLINSKYQVVVTNPPYMGISGMSTKLAQYVKQNYDESKADMFAVFTEKCKKMTHTNCYYSLITQPSLLVLSSFEKLRKSIYKDCSIISLLHMGRGIFGIDFGSTAFVIKKTSLRKYVGGYFRLHERTFQYIEPEDIECLYLKSLENQGLRFDFSEYDSQNRKLLFNTGSSKEQKIFFKATQDDFLKIPGAPVAYWVSKQIFENFSSNKLLGDIVPTKKGLDTGDNDRYLRLWHEVEFEKIGIGFKTAKEFAENQKKWAPHDKGGDFRRWYGNKEWIINWEKNGFELHNSKANLRSEKFYFNDAITWGSLSAGKISFRWSDYGAISNTAGSSLYPREKALYLIALMNTNVVQKLLDIVSPTLNYSAGPVGQIPVIISSENESMISEIAKENIEICKEDWNYTEISWDYKMHPLISIIEKNRVLFDDVQNIDIGACFSCWKNQCEKRFMRLKNNEEKLNQLFSRIYNLQEEIIPSIEDRDISVSKADISRDIKSLISYAVGCIFGRYSLGTDGITYAGGTWNRNKYSKYIPDVDNCIPITDEDYFEDDIVGLFCDWMKIVFGEESLETNLDFIANALNNKGKTSREVIRNYFLNDFIKEHIKTYQKRPIYWMFDSGKQNGFKCITYMHRYDRDTVGRVRSDYLRKAQEAIESALKNAEYTIQNSSSAIDKANATKKRDKYIKQLSEIRTYFQALSHVALQRIDIDLDDGVKVNYEKFQNIEIVDENGKKQKINLLAKI